jgi:hypothetical protein
MEAARGLHARVDEVVANLAQPEPAEADEDDDLPDTSGIDADSIRRTLARLMPADAEEVKRREIVTLTAAQVAALITYYRADEGHHLAALGHFSDAVRLCLPPLDDWQHMWGWGNVTPGIISLAAGATLTARCTLAQSLRAMEAAQWLLGCVETHTP